MRNNEAIMAEPMRPRRQFRRSDQFGLIFLVVIAWVVLGGWWFTHGASHMVDIDQAEPLVARFTIDVNTADLTELMQLPGVGKHLAQAIIDSREVEGAFECEADLLRVKGIGEKMLARIRPYLRPLNENQTPTP